MNEKEIATKIYELTGLDVFRNTRRREYIEMRSLYCYILRHKHNKTFEAIKEIMIQNGKTSDHATILHAVKKYKEYCKYNKDLEKINDLFPVKELPKVNITKAVEQISVIRKLQKQISALEYELERKRNDLTPLHKLVNKIPKEKENEALERIKLMIDSWNWKYEDKCQIIGGYNSVEAY